jgi:hypothetical protein
MTLSSDPGAAARVLLWCYLGAALALVACVPGWIVLRGTVEGVRALAQFHRMMTRPLAGDPFRFA